MWQGSEVLPHVPGVTCLERFTEEAATKELREGQGAGFLHAIPPGQRAGGARFTRPTHSPAVPGV